LIPGLHEGGLYKYEIKADNGDIFVKADPYAFFTELRPKTASVAYNIDRYSWNDKKWMDRRDKTNQLEKPISVYEVHLGSWMRVPKDNRSLTYREIAPRLIKYIHDMGYTHVEFMPLAAHPYDPSWGYQVAGYYSATPRFGKPEDLMYLIDQCHQHNIGVILDWVPAHFPTDAYALAWFDGTCLYEHADPRKGKHPDWGTLVFNYGRNEVKNFLISNALFWLNKYHIDGLRVDAVASMLYLDYSRKEGEWIPNEHGGRENLEAIDFIKRLNETVYSYFPGALMIAEESTAWPAVSRPTHLGGLGFALKWNMGWMHDILEYMSQDPVHRKYHHNMLSFALMYTFYENFVLSFSHDEVVHGKGSLIAKMPGDNWQKFANLRLLYGYMFGHPGKKHLFMGCDIGQWSEWDHSKSVEWHLLQYPPHKKLQDFVKSLNHLYCSETALYELDFDHVGFEWLDFSDADNSIVSFIRKGKDRNNILVFVYNFTPVPRDNYRVGVPFEAFYRELLNSDSEIYGGSNLGNLGGVQSDPVSQHGRQHSIRPILPPLSCLVFKPER
jgi:1,4-alpha-glucan branching enzyme